MTRFLGMRAISAVVLCLGAIAVGGAIHFPARAADEIAAYIKPLLLNTCASTSPCLEEMNTKSGAGVKGISAAGDGSIGQTKFKSTLPSNGKAGILGQDISASGFYDSGVLGTSSNGSGVKGTSVNGNGVIATSINQSALFAANTGAADGIQAVALNNDGTNSSTQNNSSISSGRSGVWGHDDSTDGGHLNVGIAGSSTNGIGISASSTNYVGLNVVGGGTVSQDYPALSVVGNTYHNLITACTSGTVNPCDGFNAKFVVDTQGGIFTRASLNALGNVDILGQYQINGTCVLGCSLPKNSMPGSAVTRYVPSASVPSVEDFGEAQLANGQAKVLFSGDFANVVDRHANYLVFITPEGDTNGLYVTQKTSSGFVVRENHGGSSTVAIQYRIVAKPYGVSGARLPRIQLHPQGFELRRHV